MTRVDKIPAIHYKMRHFKRDMYRIALNFRGSQIFANSDFWRIRWSNFAKSLHARTLHTTCQKCSLKYFREWLKIREIREIKDPRKFSTIRYMIHKQQEQLCCWYFKTYFKLCNEHLFGILFSSLATSAMKFNCFIYSFVLRK